MKITTVAVLLTLVLGAVAARAADAGVAGQWSGRSALVDAPVVRPMIVTSQSQFQNLANEIGIRENAPDVDFSRFVAVLMTTKSSGASLTLTLARSGELLAVAKESLDIRDETRWVVATYPREGVRTFEHKAIDQR